jgi:hypothetical protein
LNSKGGIRFNDLGRCNLTSFTREREKKKEGKTSLSNIKTITVAWFPDNGSEK